ncbi:MAG: glycosyltransferase family 4 protein [Armatimonadota bacterium]|nr:glycosyltransferase family 4 protein [Armatimonadota bacterium]
MKVLMLCDLPPGLLTSDQGTLWKHRFLPTPVLNLLEGLIRSTDVEPIVLTFSRHASAEGRLWGRIQVRVQKVSRGAGLSTLYLPRIPAVRRAAVGLEADVVHGQGVESGYAWLATLQPRPHVITLHGVLGVTAQLQGAGIWGVLGRIVQGATLTRARNIVAISEYIAKWARQRTRAHVYPVPNAVHRTFYDLIPSDDPTFDVLYVGRILPAKGLLDAIEAIHLLEQRGIVVRMGVVGRATDRAFERTCRERALSLARSTITFCGAVAARVVMSRARVLVLPSRGESFSMVAAEASAAHVPVVAYRVGGLPSVVAHGETGLLVAPGDVEALAEALGSLVTDERLRRRMGDAAHERALDWHQDRVARLTARVYEDVLRGDEGAGAQVFG